MARFEQAWFGADVRFDDVRFGSWVEFEGNDFAEEASFRGVVFGDFAKFTDVRFDGVAAFDGARSAAQFLGTAFTHGAPPEVAPHVMWRPGAGEQTGQVAFFNAHAGTCRRTGARARHGHGGTYARLGSRSMAVTIARTAGTVSAISLPGSGFMSDRM